MTLAANFVSPSLYTTKPAYDGDYQMYFSAEDQITIMVELDDLKFDMDTEI